jgi:hypothetical protein
MVRIWLNGYTGRRIRGVQMYLRVAFLIASFFVAGAASAEQLNAEAARRFVIGKHFAYTCFDGTQGAGRINSDGSVAGTIQMRGTGPVRYAVLPPGTLQVKGEAVCASLRGVPFEPCFNVVKTDPQSFRGSVSGFNFAYCNFTRRNFRPTEVRTSWRAPRSTPMPLAATASQPTIPELRRQTD